MDRIERDDCDRLVPSARDNANEVGVEMTKGGCDEGHHEEATMKVVGEFALLRAPARMHVQTFRMPIGVPPAANLGGSIWVCY